MNTDHRSTEHRISGAPAQGPLLAAARWALPVLAFTLLWLLVTIPAQWAMALAGPHVAAQGVRGSLWHGNAGNLMLRAGDTWLALGESHWSFLLPDSLRSAAFCIRIESRLAEQAVQGRVCAHGTRLQATHVELSVPAAATQVPGGLQLAGSILLLVESLDIDAAQVQQLVARGSWEGAALHDGRRWIELGTLGMQTSEEQMLQGLRAGFPEWHLFDVTGPLQLDLRAGMDASGRLRLAGEATPRSSASPALRAILDFVAAGSSGESYRLAL